jgi:hypothetical protein
MEYSHVEYKTFIPVAFGDINFVDDFLGVCVRGRIKQKGSFALLSSF